MNDAPDSGQAPEERFAAPLAAFFAALQFLTVAPPVVRRMFTERELGQAVGFFPLVGALIGGLLLGANALFARFFPPALCAALLLALWVLLSGALHMDGFLDACDGLLGGFTPQSRLRILKDEHKGAFAVTGGILLLLVKFTAVQATLERASAWPAALLLAPVLGRWGIALAIGAFPYARPQGLGRSMKDQTGAWQVWLATLVALLAAWFAAQWIGLAALLAALVMTWGVAVFTLRRIPGLTGDIYGAINELVEVVVLVLLAARLS